MTQRNYSLSGPDADQAIASGLVTQYWYQTPLARKDIKRLMQRSDQPALRDTAILLLLMAGTAAGGIALWPSWWSAPFWLAYSVLYGSAMDSRWHECGHGTAFKTRRLNTLLYQNATGRSASAQRP